MSKVSSPSCDISPWSSVSCRDAGSCLAGVAVPDTDALSRAGASAADVVAVWSMYYRTVSEMVALASKETTKAPLAGIAPVSVVSSGSANSQDKPGLCCSDAFSEDSYWSNQMRAELVRRGIVNGTSKLSSMCIDEIPAADSSSSSSGGGIPLVNVSSEVLNLRSRGLVGARFLRGKRRRARGKFRGVHNPQYLPELDSEELRRPLPVGPGYSYLTLLKPSCARQVLKEMGCAPRLRSLLSFGPDVFLDFEKLRKVRIDVSDSCARVGDTTSSTSGSVTRFSSLIRSIPMEQLSVGWREKVAVAGPCSVPYVSNQSWAVV